jgi:hypothetical protein
MIGCADHGAMLTGEQQGIVCDRARLAMPAGLRRSAQWDGQNCTPPGQLCAAPDVPADGDAVGRSAQGVWRDRSNPCRRTVIPGLVMRRRSTSRRAAGGIPRGGKGR